MIIDLLIKLALAGLVFFAVLNLAGLHTWVERKQSALIQDRIGANRAPIFGFRLLGIFHGLADAIKMFTKEDIVPKGADRSLHTLAPFFSVFFALVAFAAIPFGPALNLGDRVIDLQVAKINAALLFVFAMLSLGVYGVILAGFASRNNYAILGGLRATAQMISYEIALGLSIIGVIMVYGTMDLSELVRNQGHMIGGWIPFWGIVAQPMAFFVFVIAGLAVTKRVPFDLPEAESEIIGYFVEYSGMKFGLFFMSELIETILFSAIITVLFFGGWHLPGLDYAAMINWQAALVGGAVFWGKVIVGCWFLLLVRWTLPRMRFDQLLDLGWKYLLPAALLNILLTGAVLMWLGEGA